MEKFLTSRQQQTLRGILNNLQTQGFPPTIRELKDVLQINSLRGVVVHLEALEKKGYIKRSGKARGIKVLKKIESGGLSGEVEVPLIGRIAAGQPILSEENIEKYVPIRREYLQGNAQAFLLRVQGESMIEAGIEPNDLVIVLPSQSAENGDLVVALLEDEVTLKKFHRIENYIALLPANPSYEPIIGREFSIQGRVIGVIRETDQAHGSVSQGDRLLPIYKMRTFNTGESPSPRWTYGVVDSR